jgi:hypothetical protein
LFKLRIDTAKIKVKTEARRGPSRAAPTATAADREPDVAVGAEAQPVLLKLLRKADRTNTTLGKPTSP